MIGISKERLDKAKNNTELDWDTLATRLKLINTNNEVEYDGE